MSSNYLDTFNITFCVATMRNAQKYILLSIKKIVLENK